MARLEQTRPELLLDRDLAGLWSRGRFVALYPLAYLILAYLADHPRVIVRSTTLLQHCWDHLASVSDLYPYIHYLRVHVESDPHHPKIILTRRRLGYLYVPDHGVDRHPIRTHGVS